MRLKQGGFICGVAPYGYRARKDEDGIRRLYPDENTAPIVKEIFDAYLKGLSTSGISKLLLEKKYILQPITEKLEKPYLIAVNQSGCGNRQPSYSCLKIVHIQER